MTRRRLLTCGWLGACGAAGVILARAYGGSRRQPRRLHASSDDDDQLQLTIEDTPSEVGILSIRASARLGHVPFPMTGWWYLQVRNVDPVSGHMTTEYPEREYQHQAFHKPAGQAANPTFTEQIAAPPGRYNVLVGLREWASAKDQHGNVIEPHMGIGAVSRELTVR